MVLHGSEPRCHKANLAAPVSSAALAARPLEHLNWVQSSTFILDTFSTLKLRQVMAAVVNEEAHHDAKQTPSIKQVASNTPGFDERDEQLELALANYVPGTDLEKKLVRKVDWYMIPTLWAMCVLCFLNRNNIVSISVLGVSATRWPLSTDHDTHYRATPMPLA